MGGVTLCRVNQVLRSLTKRALVKTEGKRHVLTDDGLRCLPRRDRASVSMILRRWTAERHYGDNGKTPVCHGSSLRDITSQMDHHAAVTSFAATTTGEAARSEACEIFDLQPSSRSTIGYKYNDTNYVLHPDAVFLLGRWGYTRHCLLEFGRRAITPNGSGSDCQTTNATSEAVGPSGTTEDIKVYVADFGDSCRMGHSPNERRSFATSWRASR